MGQTPHTSTYDRVNAIVEKVVAAAAEREQLPEYIKLVEMIESERHLLVGAKALAVHTERRFTEDTDYVVGNKMFQRVSKWLQREKIQYEDLDGTIRCEPLGIDVFNAG